LQASGLNDVKNRNDLPLITQSIMHSVRIALPVSGAEQEAIAEALSDADALIESLEHLIAKKRHLKQGAMQDLLTGKKRLPGFTGEWPTTELGAIAERIVGGGTPSRAVNSYWDGDIPWMTVKDFAKHTPYGTLEYITREGLSKSASHLIPEHTLITSTRMALGKAVMFEVDVSINQDLKAIFTTSDMSAQFLYYWFQLKEPRIAEMGSGSTVMGLSVSALRKIPFAKPSYPEQAAIAAILSDMDTEIAVLEAKLAKARQLKQGMMQELLTGRKRLQ
jgi:type I restriction enzyme S subunit